MTSLRVRRYLVVVSFLLGAVMASAQTGERSFCYADQLRDASLEANPEIQRTLNSIEEVIRSYGEPDSKQRGVTVTSTSSAFIVPVVVYVVHNNGVENISNAQVMSQIAALNAAFSSHGIRFCLATKDNNTPLPGTTPGIIHVQSGSTNHLTAQEAALKSVAPLLAGDRYLRIWVVKDIDNQSGVVGYARFPGTVPPALEGVVMRYDVFGDASTCIGCPLLPNYDRGQVLAHEVGHFLNLFHTFQAGCTGIFASDCATSGDHVCDTPQIATAGSGCPLPGSVTSCNGTPALTDNEMDYTNDLCRTSFTLGQETRMLATLAMFRPLLVSTPNLIYTGVQCAAGLNASFIASNSSPCTTQAVTFQPLANSGATYAWSFGDGGTSAVQSPSPHTYAASGTYAVTLTVTAGGTSVSSTQNVVVSTCTPITSSQGNWYFGNKAALDFSTGTPVAVTNSAMLTTEGCITQSSAAGSLLFYSDSVNVYDKNHALMNPSTPLNGNQSNSQSSISVPDPGNPNRYYLFTLGGADSGSAALWSTIVDFSSSSNGVLTSVNTPVHLTPNLTEQITAVGNCSNTGYWIIVHARISNAFLVYSLTASGVSGPASYPGIPGTYGTIKISPDGTLLAQSTLASSGGPFVSSSAVYDFNRATGAITLRHTLAHGSYGASFSPDSKLLYMAEYPLTFVAPPALIYQYDLSDPNPDATVMLVAQVTTAAPINLQLGPDKKIYVSGPFGGGNFLHVIHDPNQRNTSTNPNACGYSDNGPSLATGNVIWGLPNMIDALPAVQVPAAFAVAVSSCSIASFQAPTCATSYNWDFGDGGTSTAQNPTHPYSSASASYTVKLTLNGSTTVTQAVTIGIPASAATIYGPTVVCPTDPNVLVWNYSTNGQAGLTYSWAATGGTISGANGNSSVDVNWTTIPGTLQLTVTDPSTGCAIVNSIVVTVNCSANQCVIPPSSLADWWPFDETCGNYAQDVAGFVDNVGLHVNGPTPVAGVVGGALSFDGIDDSVVVADNPEINFYGGCILDFAEAMTIETWVKAATSSGTGVRTILDKRVNPAQPSGFSLFLFNGRLGFQINGANFVGPSSGPDDINLADNQWHFIAVSLGTCRGATGFLYVDGKKILTFRPGTGFVTTTPLYIGARDPAFSPNYFGGALDELEIFKSPLSEDDLRAIFEARSLGKCRPSCSGKTINIAPSAFQTTWTTAGMTLTASGGIAPYQFAVTSGSLPPGVRLARSGVISGTATQSGEFSFTATAIDADGCRTTRNYSLLVQGRRRAVRQLNQ